MGYCSHSGETREFSSNLLTDPELTKRFHAEAARVIGSMYYTYYQVFEQMSVEDVVMECWKKILSQDISYDPSKGAKFETFVRMIATSKLIDITRSLNTARRIPKVYSLDQTIPNDDSVDKFNIAADPKASADLEFVEFIEELQEYVDLFTCVPNLKDILDYFLQGYSVDEISGFTGVGRSTVNKIVTTIKSIHKNRRNGNAKTVAEILYFESQEWFSNTNIFIPDKNFIKRRDYLLNVASMIRVTERVKFSDITKYILAGYTYTEISDKFNLSRSDVKSIISKYEPILI